MQELTKKNRVRPWADLPTDILSSIADRLEIIELLSFRGTCKDFRRASCNASAEIESFRTPWLLMHKSNPNSTTSNCAVYNIAMSKSYNIDLPDLKGCMFLASYKGWLLVFNQEERSIFFFSPFSQPKILLPDIPYRQIRHHATAFSDLPTAPQCIVSIRTPYEVIVISKGQTAWTRHKIPKSTIRLWRDTTIMTCATFDHKTRFFYYLDNRYHVLAFSVKDNKVKPYPYPLTAKDRDNLPFRFINNPFTDVIRYYKRYYGTRDPFQLQEGEAVNLSGLCGCTLDNFPPRSHLQYLFPNQFANAYPTKKCHDRQDKDSDEQSGVWVQPQFFQTEPDHHW